jgi:predicted AAA+ superfamily ATPase
VAALGGSPDRLLKDLQWFGLLLESLVIRDLRVLGQALDAEVYHYRDNYGVEVDAILQRQDGWCSAIEIKLGSGQVEDAAQCLLRFHKQIDSSCIGEPAFMAVICGTGYAYRREDGTSVLPIGALAP